MILQPAFDIQKRLEKIVESIGFNHIRIEQLHCFRSQGAHTRAYARIWSFPKIWQMALEMDPHYSIEVIAEKFDKLDRENQDRVLIHELLHIPKNFSGSLLSHRGRGRKIDNKAINKLYFILKNDKYPLVSS